MSLIGKIYFDTVKKTTIEVESFDPGDGKYIVRVNGKQAKTGPTTFERKDVIEVPNGMGGVSTNQPTNYIVNENFRPKPRETVNFDSDVIDLSQWNKATEISESGLMNIASSKLSQVDSSRVSDTPSSFARTGVNIIEDIYGGRASQPTQQIQQPIVSFDETDEERMARVARELAKPKKVTFYDEETGQPLNPSPEDATLYDTAYPTGTSKPIPNIQRNAQGVDTSPVNGMLSGLKRTLSFTANIRIDSKIPKIEIIKLLEDSYETSVIEQLVDDIIAEFNTKPHIIREAVLAQLRAKVNPKKKKVAPKPKPKKDETDQNQ